MVKIQPMTHDRHMTLILVFYLKFKDARDIDIFRDLFGDLACETTSDQWPLIDQWSCFFAFYIDFEGIKRLMSSEYWFGYWKQIQTWWDSAYKLGFSQHCWWAGISAPILVIAQVIFELILWANENVDLFEGLRLSTELWEESWNYKKCDSLTLNVFFSFRSSAV